ncbi:MAG: MarR family transcriptional regulator [Caulobacteraceae bacterium]|nr:MarR family transcriptional regulator [Caulobacteraceae bacterium]
MENAPTLSPAEMSLDDHLCFALYSASMAVTRLYKPMLDELGITYPQYLVLNALKDVGGDENGFLTVGGLASRLALEPSTITPLVKRLEAAGLVTRTRSPKDEREVQVRLAGSGRDVIARSTCLAEALLAKSDMAVSELGQLRDLVREFRTKVAA